MPLGGHFYTAANKFWTFVGNKNNKQWLIYAYHRETGEIVAYVWGKRDLATVQQLLFLENLTLKLH